METNQPSAFSRRCQSAEISVAVLLKADFSIFPDYLKTKILFLFAITGQNVSSLNQVSDPDPHLFESLNPDPDPGLKTSKNGKKVKKLYVLKCWMFSFEG
jgi:hypothetical protein